MPVGDLPGWRQVSAEDFTVNAAAGQFLQKYPTWSAYDGFGDTSKAGTYKQSNLTVDGGLLGIHVGTTNGVATVAAPLPNAFRGQIYGRYSVRFREVGSASGYKTAWLLWSDTNNWSDGEIDFPEGDLAGTIQGFNHNTSGNPAQNVLAINTGASYAAWHTATIEWTPSGVQFILDGKTVGSSTVSPSHSMHWILQTETDGGAPPASSSGTVQVDWVTQYALVR